MFIVKITNGLKSKNMELRRSDWVYDKKSAKAMAESKINSAWRIVSVREVK